MNLFASSSFFLAMNCRARSNSMVYGSSPLMETYLLPYFTYGPKRPTLAETFSPSAVSPKSRGSLNKSSASSRVILSIFWPGISPANNGFSSSSLVPICTNGPYRPIRTLTGLPDLGCVPRSRASIASSRVTDISLSLTKPSNGCQNASMTGIQSFSPREISSSSSSRRAVKS